MKKTNRENIMTKQTFNQRGAFFGARLGFTSRFPICYRLLGPENLPMELQPSTIPNKTMLKTHTSKLVCAAALTLAGLTACLAGIQTQSDPATLSSGTDPHIGTYNAYAKMTNSSGTYLITPPAGITSGTFRDASGFPSPYVSSVVVVRRSDSVTWFTNNNNSLIFPASSSDRYSLTVYVNSTPPPPTNHQPVALSVTWQ
jgi:hypothetical protein